MWWWIPVLLQAYSCSADGTVRLWDFTDGILIKVRLLPSIVVCPVLSVSVSSQSAHHTFYFLSVRVFSFFIINQLLWNWIISATVPLLHYIWLAACDQIMKDKKKYIFKHNLGHSPVSLWVKNLKYAVKQTLIRLFNTVITCDVLPEATWYTEGYFAVKAEESGSVCDVWLLCDLLQTYVIGYPIFSIHASPHHEGVIFVVTPMQGDKRSGGLKPFLSLLQHLYSVKPEWILSYGVTFHLKILASCAVTNLVDVLADTWSNIFVRIWYLQYT